MSTQQVQWWGMNVPGGARRDALEALYEAAMNIERQIGRPDPEDVARALGLQAASLIDFWCAVDAVTEAKAARKKED
jgi:hypothetical protein